MKIVKEKMFLNTETKRQVRFHIEGIQEASRNGLEAFESYRFFLLLSSIYNNKVIKKFSLKEEFIENYTGFSAYKQKKYLNILLKEGFCHFENDNLILKGRNVICERYDFLDEKKLPIGKFGFLNVEDLRDPNKLKTIVLELATMQKTHKALDVFLINKKNKGLGTFQKPNKLLQGANISIYTKEILRGTANNSIKTNLSLDEIAKLFNLKHKSNASVFLKKLEEKGLITSQRIFLKIREISKKENLKQNNQKGKFLIAHLGTGKPYLFEENFKKINFNSPFDIPRSGAIRFLSKIENKRCSAKPVILHKTQKELGISLGNTLKNSKYKSKEKGLKFNDFQGNNVFDVLVTKKGNKILEKKLIIWNKELWDSNSYFIDLSKKEKKNIMEKNLIFLKENFKSIIEAETGEIHETTFEGNLLRNENFNPNLKYVRNYF